MTVGSNTTSVGSRKGPSTAAAVVVVEDTHATNGRAPPKVTPLPTGQLAIICTALLTESVCFTMLIPFVGYYVSFMTGRPVEEAGYSVGYLVGFFMIGQMVSSKMWGVLSEKWGRKAGLVLGISVCSFSVLFFGLSPNVFVCAMWRFIHGLGAGSSIGARTMIADLTDRTNQAKGFALVSLTWGIGTLLGPAIGGALWAPAEQDWLSWLHLSKTGFLATHPAFLPCAVASLYNLVAAVLCAFFLNETGKYARPIYMSLPRCIGEPLRPLLRWVQPKLPCYDINAEDDGEQRGGGNKGKGKRATDVTIVDAEEPALSANKKETDGTRGDRAVTAEAEVGSWGYVAAFKDPVVRTVLIMSMLISTSDMIYNEVFPLWTIASRDVGGMGLTPPQVSVVVLLCSIPAVLANLAFAIVLSWFKNEIFFWNLTQLGYAALTMLLPCAVFFTNDNAAYWWVLFVSLIRKAPDCWCFGCILLVCAQTAPPGRVSIMYGMQQATACIVRALTPLCAAPLFAYSINGTHSFPFDQWLLYLLLCIPLLISVLMSGAVVLPPEDNGASHDTDDGDDTMSASHEYMDAESVRNTSFAGSLHSFAGTEDVAPAAAPTLLLNNSFASLAHSFANNIVSGGAQPTIIAPLTELATTRRDGNDDDGDDDTGITGARMASSLAAPLSAAVADPDSTARRSNLPLSTDEGDPLGLREAALERQPREVLEAEPTGTSGALGPS